jgi:transposase
MRIEQEVELSCLTYADRKKQISRDKRMARYKLVMALHRAGMGQRAIARELQMSRHIVQRFITTPAFPERASGSGLRAIRKSKVAPYLAYLRERWDAGMHNGSRLFDEIKQRGYTGSASGLRRLLGEWRTALPPKTRQGPPRKPRVASQPSKPRLSSRSAAFLMILPREKLTERQQHQLGQMTQHEELHREYHLAQEFISLLKERKAALLADWLKQVAECQVTELKSFANGIRRDYAAVQAASQFPWNNGIVEGHVNRLKLLKRQMFGRAPLSI